MTGVRPRPARAALVRFLALALPRVEAALAGWRRQARRCPCGELRAMALASLALKRFHCQGGSFFAAQVRPGRGRLLVRAIVALQTISDYLDNLCDRLGVTDEEAFRHLHQAMLDALSPGEPLKDYYCTYPYREDGGYLARLVQTCQGALARLPSYAAVRAEALGLASLYCTLQATKHLAPEVRQERLVRWLLPMLDAHAPSLYWWELAAATGSTLGLFALFALATGKSPAPDEVIRVKEAYFPWIGALHILLDYFIDLDEDQHGGDFNFVACYPDTATAAERLLFLAGESERRAALLPQAGFHLTLIQGLLALYLSDPKLAAQGLVPVGERLLTAAGPGAQRLYRLCRFLRRLGVV